jgi:hypothetical protein
VPKLRQRGPTFGGMTAAQPGNVPGRCGIRRPSEAACDALESVSGRTIARVDAATLRTGTARIARIDRDQRYASQRRFVGQKGPQLGKCPVVVRMALRLANRCPVTDACQVFDGNTASGVFSLPYDNLADPMVQGGCKPSLFPAPRAQQALGRLGPFPLEVAPQPRVSAPQARIQRPTERLAVTVGRDVSMPKIDAKVFGWS